MDDNVSWAEGEEFLKTAAPQFIPLIEKYGRCNLTPIEPEKYYIALLKAILNQNIAREDAQKALTAIHGRFGAYPKAEDVAAAKLVGFIPKKALRRLKDLTGKIVDGTVPIDKFPEMSDQRILSCLRKVKDLGRWTAEMFLVLAMARPDVFPSGDGALRMALRKFYGWPATRNIDRTEEKSIAAPWSPWRTLAVWYLWQYFNENQEALEKERTLIRQEEKRKEKEKEKELAEKKAKAMARAKARARARARASAKAKAEAGAQAKNISAGQTPSAAAKAKKPKTLVWRSEW